MIFQFKLSTLDLIIILTQWWNYHKMNSISCDLRTGVYGMRMACCLKPVYLSQCSTYCILCLQCNRNVYHIFHILWNNIQRCSMSFFIPLTFPHPVYQLWTFQIVRFGNPLIEFNTMIWHIMYNITWWPHIQCWENMQYTYLKRSSIYSEIFHKEHTDVYKTLKITQRMPLWPRAEIVWTS